MMKHLKYMDLMTISLFESFSKTIALYSNSLIKIPRASDWELLRSILCSSIFTLEPFNILSLFLRYLFCSCNSQTNSSLNTLDVLINN